jgi:hypothetical protein
MRRKIFQHYVDVLNHMVIGWRMGDDLEVLAELPSGRIHFDILSGQATHEASGPVILQIATEMKAWLSDRTRKDRIPLEAITAATLDLDMNTDRILTDKKRVVSFDWRCHTTLSTSEKTYEAKLKEDHTWHSRFPRQKTES